ncbi:MAG TPA: replication-relaxation family protein, partial [Nitrospira sp.]|nr:replication-relaxation family protein [Nitrospira sp.]
AGFTSTTRANARLLALVRERFLRRFFRGTAAGGRAALYMLSPRGAAYVQVPERGLRRSSREMLATDFFVEHQLIVNRLYCSLKFKPIPVPGVSFAEWKTFERPISQELGLIPDGYVELSTPTRPLAAFFEADRGHESKRIWNDKANRYLQLALSGEYQRRFGKSQFRVLVIAHSEGRLRSIRSVIAPLTEKLFWFTSLPDIHTHGFFGPVWLRPRSDVKEGFVPTP